MDFEKLIENLVSPSLLIAHVASGFRLVNGRKNCSFYTFFVESLRPFPLHWLLDSVPERLSGVFPMDSFFFLMQHLHEQGCEKYDVEVCIVGICVTESITLF